MSSSQKSRKKQGFHHKNLRQDLIAVTREAIAEHGAETLNVRMLASLLGVTHVAVYRHFDGKAGLLAEVAHDCFGTLRQLQIEARDAAGDDLYQGLVNMGLAYIEFATTNRKLFAFMFAQENLKPDEEGGASGEGLDERLIVVDQIKACQQAGLIIDVDPYLILGAIMSAPHGYAMFKTHGWSSLGIDDDIMPEAADMLELTLAPFRTEPMTPAQIRARFFKG